MLFCQGDDVCKVCGAAVTPGLRQACPSKRTVASRASMITASRITINQPAPGLGDWAEWLLAKVGINSQRYIAFKMWLGLQQTCGCDGRKAILNRVSDWFRRVIARLWSGFGFSRGR